jgi:hypothetical protein
VLEKRRSAAHTGTGTSKTLRIVIRRRRNQA